MRNFVPNMCINNMYGPCASRKLYSLDSPRCSMNFKMCSYTLKIVRWRKGELIFPGGNVLLFKAHHTLIYLLVYSVNKV